MVPETGAEEAEEPADELLLLAGVDDSFEAQAERAMTPTMAMAARLPTRLMFTEFPSGRFMFVVQDRAGADPRARLRRCVNEGRPQR
ncbi:hypothetical protein GCM10025780_16830 [Frondihabitans cladoniiphilus]|uniref:Uncharacterized protein n=1 Tax=Frondihabitans cladoniiphilus TaxID=715785 RepID=A0ABP8VVF3_9MICO